MKIGDYILPGFMLALFILCIGGIVMQARTGDKQRESCRVTCDTQRSKIIEDQCYCATSSGWTKK